MPALIRDDDMDRRDRLSLQVTRKDLGVAGAAVLSSPGELRTAVEGTTVRIAETPVDPRDLTIRLGVEVAAAACLPQSVFRTLRRVGMRRFAFPILGGRRRSRDVARVRAHQE